MPKRAPLPPDLAEFEQAAELADRLQQIKARDAAAVAEIVRRLALVREQLDAVKKAERK